MSDANSERFWKYVEPMMDDRGCWEWRGSLNSDGYGIIARGGKSQLAHRISLVSVQPPPADVRRILEGNNA